MLQVGQTMIDKSVGRFVSSHGLDYVEKGRIMGKTPIVDGDGRCWLVLPLRDTSSLDLSDTFRATKPLDVAPARV